MNRLAISLFLTIACYCPVSTAAVDPNLIGTWQLDYPGPPIFWVIREDGVYRLHGPMTNASSHRGTINVDNGLWVLDSTDWQDRGSYSRPDSETWIADGKLGKGTWKRVWTQPVEEDRVPGITPACNLLSAIEVARVLQATVQPGVRQGDPSEGCRYDSTLNGQDRLRLFMSHGSTVTGSFERRRNGARLPVDVPGVGRAAFAAVENGVLTINVLGNEGFDASRHTNLGTVFSLSLYLAPGATLEDLPQLAELAKLAYERWGGLEPLRVGRP